MREFCVQGHDQRDPANRIAFPSRPGGQCRRCYEERVKAYREAHRAQAVATTARWKLLHRERYLLINREAARRRRAKQQAVSSQ